MENSIEKYLLKSLKELIKCHQENRLLRKHIDNIDPENITVEQLEKILDLLNDKSLELSICVNKHDFLINKYMKY